MASWFLERDCGGSGSRICGGQSGESTGAADATKEWRMVWWRRGRGEFDEIWIVALWFFRVFGVVGEV